jgi:hypothetical protein
MNATGEFTPCVVHWWSSPLSGDQALAIKDADLVAQVRAAVEEQQRRDQAAAQ